MKMFFICQDFSGINGQKIKKVLTKHSKYNNIQNMKINLQDFIMEQNGNGSEKGEYNEKGRL